MTKQLEGKRIIVTGGAAGIGAAVVAGYVAEGARVAAVDLSFEDGTGEGGVLQRRLDVSDRDAVTKVFDEVVAELGGLDVLVNNAGFQMARTTGLEELRTEDMDRVFKTNLYAMFWLTRAVLPHLGRGASIINVSSIQAYQPSQTLLDYASTKAAINNFTVNLAAEVGERGIRVNAVAPGPIWTPLQPATQEGEHLESFGGDTPLGRAGQPAELAPAFVFLASPSEASYVSATVLGVTGGKPVF